MSLRSLSELHIFALFLGLADLRFSCLTDLIKLSLIEGGIVFERLARCSYFLPQSRLYLVLLFGSLKACLQVGVLLALGDLELHLEFLVQLLQCLSPVKSFLCGFLCFILGPLD